MDNSIKVEAIKHADVRGNVLNYLKLTKGEKNVVINIGEKTFATVETLIKGEQPKLFVEEEKGGKKK